MTTKHKPCTVPWAVGVFDRAEDLPAAICALLDAGFRRGELCLLAKAWAIDRKLTHAYRKPGPLVGHSRAP